MNPAGIASIRSATRNESVRSTFGSKARAKAGGSCDARGLAAAEVVILFAPSSSGTLLRGTEAVAAADRNGSGAGVDNDRVAFGITVLLNRSLSVFFGRITRGAALGASAT